MNKLRSDDEMLIHLLTNLDDRVETSTLLFFPVAISLCLILFHWSRSKIQTLTPTVFKMTTTQQQPTAEKSVQTSTDANNSTTLVMTNTPVTQLHTENTTAEVANTLVSMATGRQRATAAKQYVNIRWFRTKDRVNLFMFCRMSWLFHRVCQSYHSLITPRRTVYLLLQRWPIKLNWRRRNPIIWVLMTTTMMMHRCQPMITIKMNLQWNLERNQRVENQINLCRKRIKSKALNRFNTDQF